MDVLSYAAAISASKTYTDKVALNGVPIKYPQVDPTTKRWKVFNPVTNTYIDTGIIAEGKGAPIPSIGANGNWFVGATDTGVKATGKDGREIEIIIEAGYIKWRLAGDPSWINLVALAALKGADGREINLRMSGTILQWQFSGDSSWQDIYDFSHTSIPAKIGEYVAGTEYAADDAFIDPATKYAYHVIADYTSVSIADDIIARKIYRFGGQDVDLAPYAKTVDVTSAVEAEKAARESADLLFLSKTGGAITGPLILNGDPVEDKGAATKEFVKREVANSVNNALSFKGFISTTAPNTGLREGLYWLKLATPLAPHAPPPMPSWQVYKYTNAWTSTTESYTPDINHQWRDVDNSESWFWAGDEWEQLDYSGSAFNPDDFDTSGENIKLKDGAIENRHIALNGAIEPSKVKGITGAVENNLSVFDIFGRMKDSGKKISDFFANAVNSKNASGKNLFETITEGAVTGQRLMGAITINQSTTNLPPGVTLAGTSTVWYIGVMTGATHFCGLFLDALTTPGIGLWEVVWNGTRAVWTRLDNDSVFTYQTLPTVAAGTTLASIIAARGVGNYSISTSNFGLYPDLPKSLFRSDRFIFVDVRNVSGSTPYLQVRLWQADNGMELHNSLNSSNGTWVAGNDWYSKPVLPGATYVQGVDFDTAGKPALQDFIDLYVNHKCFSGSVIIIFNTDAHATDTITFDDVQVSDAGNAYFELRCAARIAKMVVATNIVALFEVTVAVDDVTPADSFSVRTATQFNVRRPRDGSFPVVGTTKAIVRFPTLLDVAGCNRSNLGDSTYIDLQIGIFDGRSSYIIFGTASPIGNQSCTIQTLKAVGQIGVQVGCELTIVSNQITSGFIVDAHDGNPLDTFERRNSDWLPINTTTRTTLKDIIQDNPTVKKFSIPAAVAATLTDLLSGFSSGWVFVSVEGNPLNSAIVTVRCTTKILTGNLIPAGWSPDYPLTPTQVGIDAESRYTNVPDGAFTTISALVRARLYGKWQINDVQNYTDRPYGANLGLAMQIDVESVGSGLYAICKLRQLDGTEWYCSIRLDNGTYYTPPYRVNTAKYSKSEQPAGRWLNGEPLYQKTFDWNASEILPGNSLVIETDINVVLPGVNAIVYCESCVIAGASSLPVGLVARKQGNSLLIMNTSSAKNAAGEYTIFTVKYTKT